MLGRGGMISESKVGAHVVPASRPLRTSLAGSQGAQLAPPTPPPPPPPPPLTCSVYVQSTCTEEHRHQIVDIAPSPSAISPQA